MERVGGEALVLVVEEQVDALSTAVNRACWALVGPQDRLTSKSSKSRLLSMCSTCVLYSLDEEQLVLKTSEGYRIT